MTDAGSFSPARVRGDLASLFSHSSVPLSFVGSALCGCSGCERALPESVTGMQATSSPGYIKPYWCDSKTLPKLADDADAAKAVGGDRCYLSSPAASSQTVPSNKAINLIDQHINFIATFMLQLEDGVMRFNCKNSGRKTPKRAVLLSNLLPAFVPAYEYFIVFMYFISILFTCMTLAGTWMLCFFLHLICETTSRIRLCLLFFSGDGLITPQCRNACITLSVHIYGRYEEYDALAMAVRCPLSFAFFNLCSATCWDSSSVFLPSLLPVLLQRRHNTLFSSPPGSPHVLFSPFVHVEQLSRVAELLQKTVLVKCQNCPLTQALLALQSDWILSLLSALTQTGGHQSTSGCHGGKEGVDWSLEGPHSSTYFPRRTMGSHTWLVSWPSCISL